MCTETHLGLLGIEELTEFLQFMVFIDPSVQDNIVGWGLLVRKTNPNARHSERNLPYIAVWNRFEVQFLEQLLKKCEKFLKSIGFKHEDFNWYN